MNYCPANSAVIAGIFFQAVPENSAKPAEFAHGISAAQPSAVWT